MSITTNPSPDIGDDLRALRRAAGLTQQETATRVGCSIAAVALFEGGYRPARSAVLPRLVRVLSDPSTSESPGAGGRTEALGTSDVAASRDACSA